MSSSTLTDFTILAPNGSLVIRDDGHVLCIHGPTWRTALYITTFFATNYLAHAATVKSNPGDRTLVSFYHMISALLLPMYGLIRAANAIARRRKWGGSSLENACRAGALCMVVRVPGWMPAKTQSFDAFLSHKKNAREGQDEEDPDPQDQVFQAGDRVPERTIDVAVKIYRPNYAREDSSKWAYIDTIGWKARVNLFEKRVHGSFDLPDGYGFAIMPRNSRFDDSTSADGELSSSSGMAKALASLVQTLAAFSALLGHHEDLIDRWGYASFNLTTVPYLVMTLVNSVSNISTADYPCLYMVESPVMDEAKQRGGKFDGCVAKVCNLAYTERPHSNELKEWPDRAKLSARQVRAAARSLLSKLSMRSKRRASATRSDGSTSGAPTSDLMRLTRSTNAPEVEAGTLHVCEEWIPHPRIGLQSTDGTKYSVHHGACLRAKRALHVPMCPRFGRGDDGCEAETEPPKVGGWTGIGILVQIAFSSVVVGVVILIVASQSHWLSAGHASLVQKIIMLLWICEGVYGVLFPLTLQILSILASRSFISLLSDAGQGNLRLLDLLVYIAAYLILVVISALQQGVYVAPIWGLVIVGQMLTEWGRCVTLY